MFSVPSENPSCFVIKMSRVLLLVSRNAISVSFCLVTESTDTTDYRVNLFICSASLSGVRWQEGPGMTLLDKLLGCSEVRGED